MRCVAAVLMACLLVWLAACANEPLTSPLTRIPRPTAPTPPTSEPDPPPARVRPFRRTIVGTVRQVGGGPLAAVEVVGGPALGAERPKVVTLQDGSFRIDQTVYEYLLFEKQGHHPAFWHMPADTHFDDLQTVAVRMQPHILLSSGSRFSGTIVSDDQTFEGGYPFGDVGRGYQCSPCKLITVAGAEEGAVLRLSWSGPVPLAMWAGNTDSYDGPYLHAVGRAGESELVESTASRIDAILVGLDPRVTQSPAMPVPFTLTVAKP